MADTIDLRIQSNVQEYVEDLKDASAGNQTFFDALNKAKTALKDNTITAKEAQSEYAKLNQQRVSNFEAGSEEFRKASKELQQFGKEAATAAKNAMPLSKQLRLLKRELQEMEMAGKANSKEFFNLSIRAGQLEDQIGDTQTQIRILASDTKNLDAAMGLGTGLAGGFAMAQGAAALLGGESEDLQKTMLKVQSSIALVAGAQQVANMLNKDSVVRVVGAAKAQQLYAAVVGTSTGAMKAFKIALAAMGIGLIIVAIGALIANWDKVTESVRRYLSADRDLYDAIQRSKDLMEARAEVMVKQQAEYDREIALLESIGGKEEEIYNLKVQRLMLDGQIAKEAYVQAQLELELSDARLAKLRALMITYKAVGAITIGNQLLTQRSINKEIEKQDELKKTLDENLEGYRNHDNLMKILDINELKRIKDKKDKEVVIQKASRDKELEAQKKFLADLAKLQDDAERSRINMLSGPDRFKAEFDLQQKQIDLMQKGLEAQGKLTKDQLDQIQVLRDASMLEYVDKVDKHNDDLRKKQIQEKDNILAAQRELEESRLELVENAEAEKLYLRMRYLREDAQALRVSGTEYNEIQAQILDEQIKIIEYKLGEMANKNKKEFSFYRLIGIDDEENEEFITALEDVVGKTIDLALEAFSSEVQIAEQRRALLDQRIFDTKNAIDRELALNEQGFASNVDGFRQQLALQEAAREKALQKEQELKKRQQQIDTIQQGVSLVTAAANIFKGFSSIPIVGQILGGIAVGALFAAFAAAKIKASQAAKLEKGGFGVVSGRRHRDGGEAFGDHIEVEQGEPWAVFNRNAAHKFGTHKIKGLVDSINMGRWPTMELSDKYINVGAPVVNMSFSSVNAKLGEVQGEIRRLSGIMSNQMQVTKGDGFRIEKRKGYTRIVHERRS